MGDVLKIHFDAEQQDLIGTLNELLEAADQDLITAIGYVTQLIDGTYEMSWAGDVGHISMIEALMALRRQLKKEFKEKP